MSASLSTDPWHRLREQRVRRAIATIGAADPHRRAIAFGQARARLAAGGRAPGECLDAWTAAGLGLPHDPAAAAAWRDAVLRAAMLVALTQAGPDPAADRRQDDTDPAADRRQDDTHPAADRRQDGGRTQEATMARPTPPKPTRKPGSTSAPAAAPPPAKLPPRRGPPAGKRGDPPPPPHHA